jgi:Tfp pilus assembly protein PilO
MTVTRKWSLLAAVLVVAILAAGWFLLVSPKRSEASDLRAQTASQEKANQMLEVKIQELQAMQVELPQQRARLATIQKRIPSNPALPSLIRDLTDAGRKAGVSLDTLSPALPVAAVSTEPAAVAPVTTTEDGGEKAAAPEPAAPVATLFQVPLTLNVTGSYFELEQFINKLEGLKRSFLVTGFTVGEPSSDSAIEGDLSLALQGRVFMSPDVTTDTATAPSTTPTTAATATAGQ